MLNCKVKNSNKNAAVISGILFFAAIVCLAFSIAGIGLRSVLQAIMLILVVAAMMICERYYIASFEYVVTDKTGDYDFVVIRTSGRRRNTVCRLSLSAADKLICISANEKNKPDTKGKLYDYTGSMLPQKYYLLTFSEEDVTRKLELNGDFAAVLAKLIAAPSET